MKIAVIDLETTGLDVDTNEIIEIGGVIFDDTDFKIIDTIDLKVKPEHPEIHHPKAYEVNGYNEADWKDALPLYEAMKIFKEKTEGCMFCAHNIAYDYNFVQKAFAKTGLENKMDYHNIDIFTLAWAKIPHDEMPRWGLKAICEYLQIPPEPAIHRGINGAMAEYEVYKKLMQ